MSGEIDGAGELNAATDTDRLHEAVRNGEPATRMKAIEALAETAAESSVPVLADAILDPEPAVQQRAIETAARLELDGTVSALATVLERDPDHERRVAAIDALGRIGTDDAAVALLAALDDGPTDPICEALESIDCVTRAGTATQLLARLSDTIESGDEACVRALSTVIRRVDSPPAIGAVREAQRADSTLASTIGQLDHYERIVGDHGLVSAAAFDSPDPVLRRDAADEAGRALTASEETTSVDTALGETPIAPEIEMDAQTLVEHLLDSLDDDDFEVRREAAMSLLAVRDRRAIGPLCRTIAQVADAEPEIAESLFTVLLLYWPGRQIELLVTHLKSSDEAPGVAQGVLVRWLSDRVDLPVPSHRLRHWLAARRSRAALAAAEPGDRDPDDVAVLAVAGSAQDVPALLDALDDPDSLVRAQGAFALGHLGCSLQRLSIETAQIRAGFTIDAFGGVRDDRVPQALLDALAAETDPVAIARLADALGMYGVSDAVEPLVSILGRPEPLCRELAAAALGRIGDERAVPALCEQLRVDDDERVRGVAAAALGAIGDERAIDTLDTALQEDQTAHVRTRAASALGRFDSDSADRSLETATQVDETATVRRTAALATGGTPFRGTRFEGPARTIRRATLSAITAVLSIAWAVALPLGRLGTACWRGIKPIVSYLFDALLGWLVILSVLLILALLAAGIGALV